MCGSYLCNDLLGCDISTSEGGMYAKENRLFTEFCPKMVAAAVGLIVRLIYWWSKINKMEEGIKQI